MLTKIIDRGITYSQRILNWQIDNYYDQLKIPKGSTVMLLSDYSFYSIALFLALVKNKNVIIPVVNDRDIGKKITSTFCEYVIRIIDKKLFITGFSKRIIPMIESLNGDAGLILFSSGTTGEQKVILYNLDLLIKRYAIKKTPDSVFLVFLMFDHMGGINTLLHCLTSESTIVIPESRNPDYICKLIAEHKITVLPTSPTFLNLVLLSEAYKNCDMSSLKLITYGSEPMPESLLERLKNIFNVKFHQTFGISELGVLKTKSSEGTFMVLNEEYKVVNSELWIKKPSSLIGYLNQENTQDEWYKTGDMVEEKDGALKISGRINKIINVGGHKVNPAEVESVLFMIPEIKNCKVYGDINLILGEVIVADIVTDVKLTKKYIVDFCATKLDKYKIPMKINIVKEIGYTERFKKQ
jgi:acyl-coenzyme A synthetase/AMP-(fatty) acid ligase